MMAYRHGFRASELIALRWDQIDLKAGTLHVARLKHGSPSTHPLRGPELRARRLRKKRVDYLLRYTRDFSLRPGLYREYPRDFFDLIIVDECHRGSAREGGNWREILEWFEPAYQLGMTATPARQENRDTYLYFGNPVYQYSLKQVIQDGFLAPYRVHRVVTEWDAIGWRPTESDLDRYGRAIPDEEYHTGDFERIVALRARTEAIARHLTEFLKRTDRFAKTIVFCVDQEHAQEMRAALIRLNADLVRDQPDYVCRVTADEGDVGRRHMQNFQDVERQTPTILTTSQLLVTGPGRADLPEHRHSTASKFYD